MLNEVIVRPTVLRYYILIISGIACFCVQQLKCSKPMLLFTPSTSHIKYRTSGLLSFSIAMQYIIFVVKTSLQTLLKRKATGE